MQILPAQKPLVLASRYPSATEPNLGFLRSMPGINGRNDEVKGWILRFMQDRYGASQHLWVKRITWGGYELAFLKTEEMQDALRGWTEMYDPCYPCALLELIAMARGVRLVDLDVGYEEESMTEESTTGDSVTDDTTTQVSLESFETQQRLSQLRLSYQEATDTSDITRREELLNELRDGLISCVRERLEQRFDEERDAFKREMRKKKFVLLAAVCVLWGFLYLFWAMGFRSGVEDCADRFGATLMKRSENWFRRAYPDLDE